MKLNRGRTTLLKTINKFYVSKKEKKIKYFLGVHYTTFPYWFDLLLPLTITMLFYEKN